MPDGIYALQAPYATGDASLPVLLRDPLLSGQANAGVRFLADLPFGWCYPGGAFVGRPAPGAPADGARVADIAERNDASVVVASGQTIGYAGGGFDFSALTIRGSYLSIPAAVAADLWSAYSGTSQRFLAFCYVRLPISTDWNANGVVAPFLSWAAAVPASGVPDIVTVAQGSGGTLQSLRQTAGASLQAISINVPGAAYGQLAQIAYWRNAGGGVLRLRTAASGITSGTSSVGSDNTENFSARDGRWGVGTTYWSSANPLNADHIKAKNFRMYRGGVINLARWNVDPTALLDADWSRVQGRIAASAAANGGTSAIFV